METQQEPQQEPCQEVINLRNAQQMLQDAYLAYDALDCFETDALAAALEQVHTAETAIAAAYSALTNKILQAIAEADTMETLGQIEASFP